jgi:hypothetical protein
MKFIKSLLRNIQLEVRSENENMFLNKSFVDDLNYLAQTERPIDKTLYKEFLNGVTYDDLSRKYNLSKKVIQLKVRKQMILTEATGYITNDRNEVIK